VKKGKEKYLKVYMHNEPDFRLWEAINAAHTLLSKYRSRELLKYGISHNYSWTLNVIKTLGDDATISGIAKYSTLEKHSISEILNRMLKKGLITKETGSNSREPPIRLTAEGMAAQKNARKRESIHRAMSILTEEEVEAALACLEKIVKNVAGLLISDEEAEKASHTDMFVKPDEQIWLDK